MRLVTRLVGAGSLAIAALLANVGAAQPQPQPQPQPGQPRPGQPQPGQPQPGQRPPVQMPQPGQPQPSQVQPRPIQMQPGQQLPPGFPQPSRPRQPGPGGPGGMPPGHPPIPGAPHAEAHEHAGAGEHECPGHGPMDSPPHVNWYQGLLGVNNEKAESPSGLDRLLWRYKNENDECDAKNQEPPVLANLINFGIVVLLLFRFGGTPLRDGLIKRKKAIMQDIEAAATLRDEAEARLKKYQKQLSNIEQRRTELEDDYRAQFAAEKKRILDEAEEKRARMRKDAAFRVAQELRQAEADLLSEAIDGAIRAAEELVKQRVQQGDLDRLADEYLTGIGPALKASQTLQGDNS